MKKAILITIIVFTTSCATSDVREIEKLDYTNHVIMRHIAKHTGEERQFPNYYEQKKKEKDSLINRFNQVKKEVK